MERLLRDCAAVVQAYIHEGASNEEARPMQLLILDNATRVLRDPTVAAQVSCESLRSPLTPHTLRLSLPTRTPFPCSIN